MDFQNSKNFFKKSLSCRVCLLNRREWQDRWKKTSDQVWRAQLRLSGSDEWLPQSVPAADLVLMCTVTVNTPETVLKAHFNAIFFNNSLLCIAKNIPQLSILPYLPASSHAVKAQFFKIRLGPLFWNETTWRNAWLGWPNVWSKENDKINLCSCCFTFCEVKILLNYVHHDS